MVAVAGGVGAIEPFEQVRQVFGADALSVVFDAEDHVGAALCGGEGDPSAGGGVSQGVVEQIAQYLGEPLPVGPHRSGVTAGGVQGDVLGGVAVGERHVHGTDEICGVHPVRGDQGMGLLGLGQGGGIGGEMHQPGGLLAQHRDRFRVEGFHPVLDRFEVGLQYGYRGADLVGQVAEHPPSGRFHRLETFGHLVERGGQLVELVTEPR